MKRTTIPACLCDACECGRKPCPCPSACQLPEPKGSILARWPDGLVVVAGVLAGIAYLALVVTCLAPGCPA